MNILYIADVSISQVIGGAERVLYEQSTRLAQRGHLVHILTRQLANYRGNRARLAGLIEWRYPIDRRNALSFLWSTYQNSKRLFEMLNRKYGYDCIHFHQPFSALGVNASSDALQARRIYTCHSLAFEEYITRSEYPTAGLDKVLHGFHILVRKWLERKALEQADHIIVLSSYTQAKLFHTYGIPKPKTAIIAGGTDMNQFSPVEDKLSIRADLNLPLDNTLLFTVRNMVPRMGLESLLVAFAKVLKIVANVHLVIGGDGALKDTLHALAQRLGILAQVTFTGFIPDDQLADYYRMADLFILPTKDLEGFGLVTIEALASGVPVVGTPVGGTKEILGGYDQGFLFKDSSPDAMAQLIKEKVHTIQNDPVRWREISLACRQYAEDNYSWEQNLDALEKIMHN